MLSEVDDQLISTRTFNCPNIMILLTFEILILVLLNSTYSSRVNFGPKHESKVYVLSQERELSEYSNLF